MPYAAVTVLLPVQPALLLARSSWGVSHQSSIFCSNSLQCFVSLCELLSTGKLLPVWTGFYETVKSKRPNFVSTQLEVMHHLGQIAWEGVLAPCNLELISCVHKHYVSLAPFSHYSTFLRADRDLPFCPQSRKRVLNGYEPTPTPRPRSLVLLGVGRSSSSLSVLNHHSRTYQVSWASTCSLWWRLFTPTQHTHCS